MQRTKNAQLFCFFATLLMIFTPLLYFFGTTVQANALSQPEESEKVYLPNSENNVKKAEIDGEEFTKERIKSGDLIVDEYGNLQVTDQWINKIKKEINPNYDVIADGAAIVLIEKNTIQTRAAKGGVTKIVNTWKGFDLYLKDSHCKNISDAQQIAGIVAPIVGGPLGSILGGLAAASSVVINRVNKGNGVIIAFLGRLQLNPPPIVHWIAPQ